MQTIFPPLREGNAPVYLLCFYFCVLQIVLVFCAVLGFRGERRERACAGERERERK